MGKTAKDGIFFFSIFISFNLSASPLHTRVGGNVFGGGACVWLDRGVKMSFFLYSLVRTACASFMVLGTKKI